MGKKLTQKDFNEEMFSAVYDSTLAEGIVVSHLLETALNVLEQRGYDVPDYEVERGYDGGVDYHDNAELLERLNSFTKRFQKLTGYDYE